MYKCQKCDFVAKTEVGLRKHENRKIPCDAKKTKGKQKVEEKPPEQKDEVCIDCPKDEKPNIDDDFTDERIGKLFLEECDKLFKKTRNMYNEHFKELEDKYTEMNRNDDFDKIINSIISVSNEGNWFMWRCQYIHKLAIEKHDELDEKEVRRLFIKLMFKNEIEGILSEIITSRLDDLLKLEQQVMESCKSQRANESQSNL